MANPQKMSSRFVRLIFFPESLCVCVCVCVLALAGLWSPQKKPNWRFALGFLLVIFLGCFVRSNNFTPFCELPSQQYLVLERGWVPLRALDDPRSISRVITRRCTLIAFRVLNLDQQRLFPLNGKEKWQNESQTSCRGGKIVAYHCPSWSPFVLNSSQFMVVRNRVVSHLNQKIIKKLKIGEQKWHQSLKIQLTRKKSDLFQETHFGISCVRFALSAFIAARTKSRKIWEDKCTN